MAGELLLEEIDAPRKRGRPKGSTKAFIRAQLWKDVATAPLKAHDVLLMAGERQAWARVFRSDDERVILTALMFLTTMRDGKPAQSINVTSMNVNVSADDIARARAVALELVGSGAPTAQEPGESVAPPLMLQGDEGGKEGGEVG